MLRRQRRLLQRLLLSRYWPVPSVGRPDTFSDFQRDLDVRLITAEHDAHVTNPPAIHRVQVAVDCECGMTVQACDDEELLDEFLEHIAAAHEAGMRREPAALLAGAYVV